MFWYDVIDSTEGPVEDYELAIREWMSGQPHPTSHPKKDTLISIATQSYWQSQQDSIGGICPNPQWPISYVRLASSPLLLPPVV
jgi:hypothetical protein